MTTKTTITQPPPRPPTPITSARTSSSSSSNSTTTTTIKITTTKVSKEQRIIKEEEEKNPHYNYNENKNKQFPLSSKSLSPLEKQRKKVKQLTTTILLLIFASTAKFSSISWIGYQQRKKQFSFHYGKNTSSSSSSSSAAASGRRGDGDGDDVLKARPDEILCFITSIYGKEEEANNNNNNNNNKNNNKKTSSIDTVRSVSKYANAHPSFRYYVFTNLPNLSCPGWERILLTDLPYRRYVTQSRWAKFLGWKHSKLQHCTTIFYADAWLRPTMASESKWLTLSRAIHLSEDGLMQNRHPKGGGVMAEFKRIVVGKKDIVSNVVKSIQWLQNQPDFHDDCILYLNMQFGYDPKNQRFQKASQFFWDHYSKEEDSWRDQPLWCYVLDVMDMKPIPLGNERLLWDKNLKYYDSIGHTYSKETDNQIASSSSSSKKMEREKESEEEEEE